VSWTIRWNLSDFYRRWTIGDHTVLPDEARRRAWHVKSCCQQSVDPTPQITEWITGVPIGKQVREVKSIAWDTARKLFLDHILRTRRPATHDDYRNILENTPELAAFDGKSVASITEFNVAAVLGEVSKRTEAHAEHVQRILSSMWTFLATPENRPTTGVVPSAIRHVRAPERTRREIGDYNAPAEAEAAPPDRIEIGRYLAIARLGAFPPRMSAALLLLAGSAQRRRPVAGARLPKTRPSSGRRKTRHTSRSGSAAAVCRMPPEKGVCCGWRPSATISSTRPGTGSKGSERCRPSHIRR
jgi:hypothetical protein